MKVLAQTYGPQLRSEVLGDAVQKAFSDAVREAKLRVAGQPRIEPKKDVAASTVERPQVTVDDAAVDKTLEILRKQRVTYAEAMRAAQAGDRVTVDFAGSIGGEALSGRH